MSQTQVTLAVEDWEKHLQRVVRIAVDYWANIDKGPVAPQITYGELRKLFMEGVPEQMTEIADLLTEFEEKIMPYCTKLGHPRFLAWLLSGPSPAGTLGAFLADAVNQIPAMYQSSPAGTVLEEAVVGWFGEIFGFPASSGGVLTGGGTEATEIGLTVAREEHFPGAMRRGMAELGVTPVLYASDQVHSSVVRAASLLGIGGDFVRLIPCDEIFRLDVAALRQQIAADRTAGLRPFCVVAQVGTSNTGAVDPLQEIAAVCRENGLWMHVDAAYGGAAILTDYGRVLLAGIEQADSLATDPHKWFFVPAEAGCVLIRDRKKLWQVFGSGAAPEPDAAPDLMQYGIQCTRSARAFKIWFAFRAYGMPALGEMIAQNLAMARELQLRLRRTGKWEIVAPAELSALCFRRLPLIGMPAAIAEQLQKTIVQNIANGGEALLNTAMVKNKLCIRVCFVNNRTRWEDIDILAGLLEEAADQAANMEFAKGI